MQFSNMAMESSVHSVLLLSVTTGILESIDPTAGPVYAYK